MKPSDDTRWNEATPGELADALRAALLLDCEPVGVKIFSDAESFAAWQAPTPEVPVSYCSAVKMASVGTSIKMQATDFSCDVAPRVLGLESSVRDEDFVATYVAGELYPDMDVARDVLADVVTLGESAGIAVAPLGAYSADALPDVVLLPTSAYGAMRVAQAAGFWGRHARSRAIGMHGVCSESTAAPCTTGEVSISLLCSGSRYLAGWDETLMSVGVPMSLASVIVSGLIRTADRFETDERKGQLRGVSGCLAPRWGAEKGGALNDGAGYFCGM